MAIDYGRKRVGLAVTDPMQMIANGLETVHAKDIIPYLKEYFAKEQVDEIVVGYPRQLNNQPSEAVEFVEPFLKHFRKQFPDMPVRLVDERFTSKLAMQAMIDGGLKKKDRRNKALVDSISATIILQSYMELKGNTK
jgi:putative Holliday junction resolvase